MAIGHIDRQPVSRAKGQSIMAKAAYNACSKLEAADGEKDYTKKSGLVFEQLIAQRDIKVTRQEFWQAVDRTEKRKDAQLGYSYEAALPIELDKAQQIALAQDFSKQILNRYGFEAVDLCIHHPKKRKKTADKTKENPHLHLLTPTRTKTGEKLRLFGKTDDLVDVRKIWEETANRHLAAAGVKVRISVDTLEKQIAEKESQLTKVEKEIEDIKKEMEAENGRLNLEASNESLQAPERKSGSMENANSGGTGKRTERGGVPEQLAGPGGHTREESRQNNRKAKRDTGIYTKIGDLDGKPISADRPGTDSDGGTGGWALDHGQPRGDAGRYSTANGGHGQSMEESFPETSHTDNTATKAKLVRPGLLIAKKINALKELRELQKALVEKKVQEYRQLTDEKFFTQRRKPNANRNNGPSRETAPTPTAPHP